MSKQLNVKKLDKKLMSVTKSKDSIQSLSLWIIFHKCHHKEIVETWLRAVEKGTSIQRLTLFYVANDVLQQCKKKGALQYKEAFADVLERAVALVTDKEIKDEIERMIAIWNERGVYTSDFLKQLQDIICGTGVTPCKSPEKSEEFIPSPEIVANFKLKDLTMCLKQLEDLHKLTLEKQDDVNCIDISNIPRHDVLPLKVRSEGLQMTYKFNEFASLLQQYLESAEKEVVMRKKTLELLEQSRVFFTTQGEEVKNVAYAYKIFGKKVKRVKKQLSERRATLFQTLIPCTVGGSPFPSDDNELSRSSTHSELPVAHETPEAGDSRTLQSPAKNVENSLDRRLSVLLQDKYLAAQCNSVNVFEVDNTPQSSDIVSLQTSDIKCENNEVTDNLMNIDVDQSIHSDAVQECDDQSTNCNKNVIKDFNCSLSPSACNTSGSADPETCCIEAQKLDVTDVQEMEQDAAIAPDSTSSQQCIQSDVAVTSVSANSDIEVSTDMPSNVNLQDSTNQLVAGEYCENDATFVVSNNKCFNEVENVPDTDSFSELLEKRVASDPSEKSEDCLQNRQIDSSDDHALSIVGQTNGDNNVENDCQQPVNESAHRTDDVENTQIHLLKSLLMLKSFSRYKSLKHLDFLPKNITDSKNYSCKETLPSIPLTNLMKILWRSLKIHHKSPTETKQSVNQSDSSKEVFKSAEEGSKSSLSAPNSNTLFWKQTAHSESIVSSATVPVTGVCVKSTQEGGCNPGDKNSFEINYANLQSTSNKEVVGSIYATEDFSSNLIYSSRHLSNTTESSFSTLHPLCSLSEMPTMSALHFSSQISVPNFTVAPKSAPNVMAINVSESQVPTSYVKGNRNLYPYGQSSITLQSSVLGFETPVSEASINSEYIKNVTEVQIPKTSENLEVMDMDLCDSDDETNQKGV